MQYFPLHVLPQTWFFCEYILKFLGNHQINSWISHEKKLKTSWKLLWKNIWYFVKDAKNKEWLSCCSLCLLCACWSLIVCWIKSLISLSVQKKLHKKIMNINKVSREKYCNFCQKVTETSNEFYSSVMKIYQKFFRSITKNIECFDKWFWKTVKNFADWSCKTLTKFSNLAQ